MTWNVWTDGSCMHGLENVPRGLLGWGGWCAIVEHGSEGIVLSGRKPKTTNVRMELLAAVEGLRAVPADSTCLLHTDCTTVVCVYDRWERAVVGKAGPDARLWLELDAEFERVGDVRLRLIVRNEFDPIHRRCHAIAGAQAKGGLRGLAPNAVPLEDAEKIKRAYERAVALRAVAEVPVESSGVALEGLTVADP